MTRYVRRFHVLFVNLIELVSSPLSGSRESEEIFEDLYYVESDEVIE